MLRKSLRDDGLDLACMRAQPLVQRHVAVFKDNHELIPSHVDPMTQTFDDVAVRSCFEKLADCQFTLLLYVLPLECLPFDGDDLAGDAIDPNEHRAKRSLANPATRIIFMQFAKAASRIIDARVLAGLHLELLMAVSDAAGRMGPRPSAAWLAGMVGLAGLAGLAGLVGLVGPLANLCATPQLTNSPIAKLCTSGIAAALPTLSQNLCRASSTMPTVKVAADADAPRTDASIAAEDAPPLVHVLPRADLRGHVHLQVVCPAHA